MGRREPPGGNYVRWVQEGLKYYYQPSNIWRVLALFFLKILENLHVKHTEESMQ